MIGTIIAVILAVFLIVLLAMIGAVGLVWRGIKAIVDLFKRKDGEGK